MKLLIVDDDIQIRDGIAKEIDWSQIGICEIKTACNGVEALELFKIGYPEIVLTDIRMPGMDGIELFKKIKKIKPSTKVIIISGYSDFDYLKTAIQYGAVDYELKPIRVKKLIALVSKVREDIIKEKTIENDFARYRETYVHDFMQKFLSGKVTNRDLIIEELQQYFNFDARGSLLLMMFELDLVKVDGSGEDACYFEKLKECFIEKPIDSTGMLFWKINEVRGVLIIRMADSMSAKQYLYGELKIKASQINRYLTINQGVTLSFGISNVGTISGFMGLYKEALEALELKFYTGKESLNFYQNLNLTDNPNTIMVKLTGPLGQAIADFDRLTVEKLLVTEFNSIQENQRLSKKSVEDLSLELMRFLNATLKTKGYDRLNSYPEKLQNAIYLAKGERLVDFRNMVLDYYHTVLTDLEDEQKVFMNKSILKAVEYIKKNYEKELTAEIIANFIAKTPNYFSHVFKKEMGINFTEYLNRIRICKAKELILSTDMLVYEVCHEVGYQNYAYFSQIFKKYENCTPTEIKCNLK